MDNQIQEVKRLYLEEHLSIRQISQALNVGLTSVTRILSDVSKRTKSEAARARFGYEPFQLHSSLEDLAYLIGVYLGDGHLAKQERTELLDIACDIKYPSMIVRISSLVFRVFGKSPSLYTDKQSNCVHVRLYGTGISQIMGFQLVPKSKQEAYIPEWIKSNLVFSRNCMRGLFETDGYLHHRTGRTKSVVIGFSNTISTLLDEVEQTLYTLGYVDFQRSYNRIDCWNYDEAMRFIADIGFDKS